MDMPIDRARKRGSISSAQGLTEPLKAKAQSRRERHRAVTKISRHDPPPRNDLVPELRIDFVSTESLKPANRQTRRKEAAQARRLDRSIAKFGITAPISVDGEDRIVHGHGIWEAAKAGRLRNRAGDPHHASQPRRTPAARDRSQSAG